MLNSWNNNVLTYADELWMRRVLEDDQKRLAEIGAAWDAYNGVNQETLKPTAAEQRAGKSADNVVLNLAQFVVDTSTYFLFGDDVTFDLDGQTKDRTPDEQYLDELWAYNRKMVFLQKLAQNGAVAGHVFIKINPPKPEMGQAFPRLINLSPEYVHVVTEPEDIDRVSKYIIQYPAIDPDTGDSIVIRQTVERLNSGERWQLHEQVSRKGGKFETVTREVWAYDWCPIIDCQNLPMANEYYGRSDIQEHVVKLGKSLNFIASNLQRIIKYHGHPRTWGQGFKADNLVANVDDLVVLPAGATLENLEMLSDLTSSLETFGKLKESYHQITGTPEVAAGKLESAGTVSGVALKILYGPLIAKTAVKRTLYGTTLVELNRRLLEMDKREPQQTTIQWPENLPSDPLAERQTALIDQQLGVSKDTLLARFGYDPDAEREKREADMQEMADNMLTAFDRGETGEDEDGPPGRNRDNRDNRR